MIPESLKNVKLLGEYLNLKQQQAIVYYNNLALNSNYLLNYNLEQSESTGCREGSQTRSELRPS